VGTSLEIAWPAVEAVAQDVAGAVAETPGGSERVLVVEDEEELRQLVRRMLVQDGYEVLDAGDPETALRIVSQDRGRIDLLLTDVVMPKMSGFELAEQLCEKRPGTRVIFISGHLAHPSLRGGEIPAGAAFVPKPFRPARLARTVREVLDQPQPGF
jgi:DNA-binding response OmpR family regulator